MMSSSSRRVKEHGAWGNANYYQDLHVLEYLHCWFLNRFSLLRFHHEANCKDEQHMFLMLLSPLYVYVMEAYAHVLATWNDFEAHLPSRRSGF
jgi:hypothetical protein